MKIRKLIAGIALVGTAQIAAAQEIPPNSSFFSVENYFYLGVNGFERYRVAGFVQPPAPGIKPKIFLFPSISVSSSDITYFDTAGLAFDPTIEDRALGSVTIKPKVSMAMPNEMQKVAIASQIKGSSISFYRLPSFKNGATPAMTPEAASYPPAANSIILTYDAYDKQVQEQAQLAADYSSAYQPVAANPNETEVRLLIGGEVATSRTYPGSTTTLSAISLMYPTEFQKNQLLAGAFEVEVRTRFPDMDTKYIQANFDAHQAVSFFLEETQEAITKSKSSGFQVFNIGSRRSKMKTSLNQSLKTDASVSDMQSTTVVMYDASDQMITEFESAFFPELTREEAVNKHLAAAQTATDEGNLGLAMVHQDYADSISTGNQLKEVDSVAAAAALSAGDYAGFIAHGVRSINSNDRKENSFRRVINSAIEINAKTEWNQTRQVSVMRETTIPVGVDQEDGRAPWIGICDVSFDVPYVWVEKNMYGFPEPQSRQGLMTSCVQASSPAAAAGLLPGYIIRSVGVKRVNTPAEFEVELKKYKPGDDIKIYVMQPPSGASPFSSEKKIIVKAKRGLPLS